jgi:hypothetical protein
MDLSVRIPEMRLLSCVCFLRGLLGTHFLLTRYRV